MKDLLNSIKYLLGHDFLVGFWSNLLADLAVAVLIGFIVHEYSNLFKKPNLIFVVKQNELYRDKILLTEKGGDYVARFQFAIKNTGSKAIKTGDGYWHLYIHTHSPTIYSAPEEQNHNRDMIQGTVYAGSFLDIGIVYELKMKKVDLDKKEIPYFFSTDYGQYPKTAKIDTETGKVLFKDMGYIKFELPI